jgi:hypothetical protein
MRNLFFAILMALIYCGTIQAQEIVSTSSGPDGKISYVIALPAVTGYYDPFVSGDWLGFDDNTWAKMPVENNGSDQYIFTITTYDALISMYYSSYSKPYNPQLSKLPYYDRAAKVAKFFLAEGKMYDASYTPILPGDGDDVLRFEKIGNKLRVYGNLVKLPKNSTQPFMLTSCNEWKKDSMTVTNSSGLGYMDIDVSKNTYDTPGFIGIGYGAKIDGSEVWPNISGSKFIHYNKNQEMDGLMIPVPIK